MKLYRNLTKPCWATILKKTEQLCSLPVDKVDGHGIAMDLLLCYREETNKGPVRNCTLDGEGLQFKRCISNYDDKAYDDFMLLFGQIRFICDYFNSTYPDISMEKLAKANYYCFFYTIYSNLKTLDGEGIF